MRISIDEAVKRLLDEEPMSADIPEGRYLQAWHFDQCHGVIGTETVERVNEMHDAQQQNDCCTGSDE